MAIVSEVPVKAEGWSARALARLLDVRAPTMTYWVALGLVRPERVGRGRRGHTIGVQGLLEAVTVKGLRHAGISLQAVRRAVEELRRLTGEQRPLATLVIVALGDDIVWKEADDVPGYISAHRRPGQRVLQIPVGEAVEMLRETFEREAVPV